MVELAESVVKCQDCGRHFHEDEIEQAQNGDHYCFDCLNYELDFEVT